MNCSHFPILYTGIGNMSGIRDMQISQPDHLFFFPPLSTNDTPWPLHQRSHSFPKKQLSGAQSVALMERSRCLHISRWRTVGEKSCLTSFSSLLSIFILIVFYWSGFKTSPTIATMILAGALISKVAVPSMWKALSWFLQVSSSTPPSRGFPDKEDDALSNSYKLYSIFQAREWNRLSELMVRSYWFLIFQFLLLNRNNLAIALTFSSPHRKLTGPHEKSALLFYTNFQIQPLKVPVAAA